MQKDNDPVRVTEREFNTFENEYRQIEATFSRLRRAVDLLAADNERLRAERRDLQFYTEQQAAEILHLHNGRSLADRRLRDQLPYIKLGGTVLYTREHIEAIGKRYELKGGPKFRNANR